MSTVSSETLRVWNKVAERYEQVFMHLSIYDAGYDALIAGLRPGARVLEVGCGPGMITAYLLRARPDLRCTVTDAAPAMLERAKANCPAAEAQLLDARELASLPGVYNALVVGFVLPYLPEEEVRRLFANAAAKLAPGGLLYLSFVPGAEADSGWQTGSTGDRMYFRYFGEASVKQWLESAGFSVVDEWRIPYREEQVHWAGIVRKDS